LTKSERTGFDDDALAAAQRREPASDELTKSFEALSATAELDQVIYDGASFGLPVQAGTPEEEEYLGIPGLLTPEQVATLLSRRQAEQTAAARRRSTAVSASPSDPAAAEPPALPAAERRIRLRRQLNGMVADYHRRTGVPHGKIHAELR